MARSKHWHRKSLSNVYQRRPSTLRLKMASCREEECPSRPPKSWLHGIDAQKNWREGQMSWHRIGMLYCGSIEIEQSVGLNSADISEFDFSSLSINVNA